MNNRPRTSLFVSARLSSSTRNVSRRSSSGISVMPARHSVIGGGWGENARGTHLAGSRSVTLPRACAPPLPPPPCAPAGRRAPHQSPCAARGECQSHCFAGPCGGSPQQPQRSSLRRKREGGEDHARVMREGGGRGVGRARTAQEVLVLPGRLHRTHTHIKYTHTYTHTVHTHTHTRMKHTQIQTTKGRAHTQGHTNTASTDIARPPASTTRPSSSRVHTVGEGLGGHTPVQRSQWRGARGA